MLKKANESLTAAAVDPKYNALWKALHPKLLPYIAVHMGDPKWEPTFYVQDRVSDGLTEADLEQTLRLQVVRQGVFVISGVAGVGKSTMLDHVIDRLNGEGALDNAVICLYRFQQAAGNRGAIEPKEIVSEVKSTLSYRLRTAVEQIDPSRLRWREYVLTHSAERNETASILLDELRNANRSNDFWSRLDGYFSNLPELAYLRLQVDFLRANSKELIVIIDNVDQLSVDVQRALLQYATYTSTGSPLAMTRQKSGFLTLLAARPEMLEEIGVPLRTTTRITYVGRVAPPRMEQVFQRRFDHAMSGFSQQILDKHQNTISLLRNSGLASDSAAALARAWARALMARGLADRVHAMTGYNTRVTLGVLTNYISSGHHAANGESSEYQVQKALSLGNQRWYSSRHAWLHNLFVDRNDGMGVVSTIWLLLWFKAAGGRSATPDHAADSFREFLGVDPERILDACLEMKELGLLEGLGEDGASCLGLAGKYYLNETLPSFDYLQHVLVDTPVDASRVVYCEPDEHDEERPEIRLRRVVNFALWVHDIECALFRKMIDRGVLYRFEKALNSETVSAKLATALSVAMQVYGWSMRFAELQRQVRELSERASFQAIEREARPAADVAT